MNYGIYQSRKERRRKSYFLLLFLVSVFAAGIAYTLWRAGGAVYEYFTRSSPTGASSCSRSASTCPPARPLC